MSTNPLARIGYLEAKVVSLQHETDRLTEALTEARSQVQFFSAGYEAARRALADNEIQFERSATI